MPFYAVAKGRSTGIYHSWADCQAQVKGFSGAKFRKFDTASSANAFIQSNQGSSNGSSYNNYQSRNNNSQKRSYASSSMKYTGSTYSFLSESDSSDDEPARKRYKRDDFKKDNEGYVQVYTDGACSGNGSQNARAGLGVYWGENHQLNKSQPVSGRATNNCGEIQAATEAIKTAHQNGVEKLTINTDSKFLS